MDLIKSYKVVSTGKILKIYLDENAESPRTWDNICILVTSHRRFTIGDEEAKNVSDYDSWEDWREHELPKDCVYSPVYMMDHSIQTLSLSPYGGIYGYFDSGQVGYIYTTVERVNRFVIPPVTSISRESADKWFMEEINAMNQWLHGEVFGFELESAEGVHEDSCWGFFGSNIRTNGLLDNLCINFDDLEEIDSETNYY